MLAETTDTAKREARAKRGAAFFQRRSRRSQKTADRNAESTLAQPIGTQPASGDKAAA
ncbi:hypothetical protein [uncultured Roseobacter sp.]|uniref:hypothetical protein n=1 Tax=uncultured Roseobacter sp. TaxID=114847 RepID=UPI00261A153E|nr:hypothetical protein [uncultured Roseobacter sp.]